MNFDREFMGKDFTWFVGIVEDREDPLYLGRVRVRCFGWHTQDKSLIPTDKLPWASTIQPVTAPATVPSGLVENTWVFGFFMDGDRAQRPMIMGLIPGYTFDPVSETDLPRGGRKEPDYESELLTQRKADRKTGVVIDPNTGATWDEPEDPDDTDYPYTQVVDTESGPYYIFSPLGRYAMYTPSGSYIELDSNGQYTVKITTDKYKLVANNENIDVGGDVNLTVGGNVNWNISGDVTWNVAGNITENVGGNVTENITGNETVSVGGNVSETVGGNVTEDISGNQTITASAIGHNATTYTIDSDGAVNITGSTVNLN